MEISFGGLASGLDTDSIISALVAVERRPISLYQQQKSDRQDQLKALDNLLEKLKDLDNSLNKVSDPDEFLAFSSSLTDDTYFSVSTTGSADQGSYNISVEQLAERSLLRTGGVSDSSAANFSAGDISITVDGTLTTVSIDDGASLLDLKDAINDSDAEVNASVVFDGTDYYLEVRAKETGVDEGATISFDSSIGVSVDLDQAGQDSIVSIDGLQVTSSTNVIDEALEGISLTLRAVSPDDGSGGFLSETLTISEDFDEIEDNVQGFISAYNDIIKFINEQSTRNIDDEDAPAPPLAGDSTLRLLRQRLGSDLTNFLDSSSGKAFNSLASLGIRSQSDGTLELDSEDFKDALASDLEDVRFLFTDATDGITSNLQANLETYTDSIDGFIKTRQDGIERSIDDLDDRISQAEARLATYEQNLVRRYAGFETLIGRLQSQGSALGAIIQ